MFCGDNHNWITILPATKEFFSILLYRKRIICCVSFSIVIPEISERLELSRQVFEGWNIPWASGYTRYHSNFVSFIGFLILFGSRTPTWWIFVFKYFLKLKVILSIPIMYLIYIIKCRLGILKILNSSIFKDFCKRMDSSLKKYRQRIWQDFCRI